MWQVEALLLLLALGATTLSPVVTSSSTPLREEDLLSKWTRSTGEVMDSTVADHADEGTAERTLA
jgi:hypothetical protein